MLLARIDYRVEVPVGAKRPEGYQWPAAYALAHLRWDDTSRVTTRLGDESSSVRRTLLAWVAYRAMGIEGAVAQFKTLAQPAKGVKRDRLLEAARLVMRGDLLPAEAERGSAANPGWNR